MMDASAAVTVCALTSWSSGGVLSLAAALRERGDDLRFPCRQISRLPRCQRPKFYRPELSSHQSLDSKIQRFTQPSYFSRPSFSDSYFDLPESPANSSRLKFTGHHDAVFQLYTLHRRSCRLSAVPAYCCEVGALNLAARMCQFVRRFTVVGQEKHALCHVIEPADIGHPGTVVDYVEHCAPPGGVGTSGQDTRRLVEYDPSRCCRRAYAFAVNENLVVLRIDRLANDGDPAVDPHPSGGDQIVSRAARRKSGARDRALNAHRFGHQSARGGASPFPRVRAAATAGIALRGGRGAIASSA